MTIMNARLLMQVPGLEGADNSRVCHPHRVVRTQGWEEEIRALKTLQAGPDATEAEQGFRSCVPFPGASHDTLHSLTLRRKRQPPPHAT